MTPAPRGGRGVTSTLGGVTQAPRGLTHAPRAVVAVETLAAFFVGAVLLGPVPEALFYGAEGFPVEADAYGIQRIFSAVAAIALLAIGAAVAFTLPDRWRGWPATALAFVVVALAGTYAPQDAHMAIVENAPLYRLVVAFFGGLLIGSCAAAALPSTPGTGRRATVAGLAAGVVGGGLLAMLPFPLAGPALPGAEAYRSTVTWPLLAGLLFAAAAALLTRDRGEVRERATPAAEPAEPTAQAEPAIHDPVPAGLVPGVSAVAVGGAVVSAAFHMQYVDRATQGGSLPVIVAVLVATVLLWFAAVAAIVWWSGRQAGPAAAAFVLVCAGGASAMYVASSSIGTRTWPMVQVPLLALVAAVAGVLLARRRRAVRWEAIGLVIAAFGALFTIGVRYDFDWPGLVAAPGAGIALGAALARCKAVDTVYGLVGLLVTLPFLLGVAGQVNHLIGRDEFTAPGFLSLASAYSPIWLSALAAALWLYLRDRTTRRPIVTLQPVGDRL